MLEAVKPEKFHRKIFQKSIILNMLLFFFIGVAITLSRWASIAIFSTKVGAESLSDIYSIIGVSYFFIAFFIIHGLSKYPVLSFIRFVFFICFLILLLDSMLFLFPVPVKYAATFLMLTVLWIWAVVEMIIWICAAQFFSTQHAKKIYAYLGGANAAGILTGSILLNQLSMKVGTVFYIFLSSLCMLLASFLVYVLQKKCWHSTYQDEEPVKLNKFIQFVLQSSDWLKIMFITIMLFCFYDIADLQLAVVGEHTYKNVSRLTEFFGLFQIFNSIALIIFSYFFIMIISRLGVWNAWMLSFFSMALAFSLLGVVGEKIYFTAFSRIVVEIFSALGFILIGIVCKNAKQKYQLSLLTFFDFIPICFGSLFAGFFCYLLKFEFISFKWLAILVSTISFLIFMWGILTKKTYLSILKSGIIDEQFQLFMGNQYEEVVDVTSVDSLQSVLNKWDNTSKKIKTLSLEIPMKIENVESLKLFLNILDGLQDKDPAIRVKGLIALTRFKNVHELTPFIIKCFEDSDPFVLGQAILTLYEFEPQLTYKNADNVIKTLINTEAWPYQVLAFEIIHLLKMKKYALKLTISMDDPEDKVRRAAYKAYGSLFEVGDEEALIELKKHMSEQNSDAAKELINAVLRLVGDKVHLFTEAMLADDPFLWKNTIALVIKLKLHSEYELMVFSGINKLHHAYENLFAISILLKEGENYYINALIQHLVLQNAIIINGIILILTKDVFDQNIIDSIGKEVRSIDPNVKATILELIENIGDPRLSKHFISYFTIDSDEERIDYAKRTWRIEKSNIQDTFSTLLIEDNEWIRACVIYIIGIRRDVCYEGLLEKIIQNDPSLLVVENAKKALIKIRKEQNMSSDEDQIDFMDIVVFLKSTILFGDINLNKLGLIAKFLEQKDYTPDSVIIEEGKKVNGMHIVYQGVAVIENLGFEITNPTVIGGQSMLEDSPSNESIFAKTKVTTFFISKKVYQNIITLHPDVAMGLLNEMCSNLRRYQERLKNVEKQ